MEGMGPHKQIERERGWGEKERRRGERDRRQRGGGGR